MSWSIPKLWEGQDCYILGGGPSLPRSFGVPEEIISKVEAGSLPVSAYSKYLLPLKGKNTIAVNMAYRLGIDWLSILFFGDQSFYTRYGNERLVPTFAGAIVTCHPWFNNPVHELQGFHYVPRHPSQVVGITTETDTICWNRNSGAAAINLAVQLGAKRIILIGFDMKPNDNGTHWHKLYTANNVAPYKRHLACFPSIAEDAKKLNVEIFNANPDSEIKDFPTIELEEVLALPTAIAANIPPLTVIAVTPTCDKAREPFLNFLKTRIAKQTRKVDDWVIVDGENETGKSDITSRYEKGIEIAFEKGADLVLLIEDDDYYPLTYVEEMIHAWELQNRPSIIGVYPTTYYDLRSKGYITFEKAINHASAFCTAISKTAKYKGVCKLTDPFYDKAIWEANKASAKQVQIPNLPLGIKHGLGLLGGGYHKSGTYKQKDTSWYEFLRTRVDKEALEFYKSLKLC